MKLFVIETLFISTLMSPLIAAAQAPQMITSPQYKEGDVIVHWKSSPSAALKHARSALRNRGLHVKNEFSGGSTQHLQSTASETTSSMMDRLQNDPDVAWVEPNYMISLSVSAPQVVASSSTSNNGTVSAQSNTFSLTTAPVQAQTGWANFVPANATLPIVAVLDSGVDTTHPALQNGLLVNTHEIPNNGIDDDGNGYIDDVNGWNYVNNNSDVTDCLGHGTHVSGIIRGVGQTITSSPAPSPLVKILPVKFLDCSGNGDTGNAVSAIYYAISRGAVVINASWGGPTYSRALHEAIAFAYSKNVVFVTAAGNASTNDDTTYSYPASLDVPNIISVAATDASDSFANFSNFGVSTVHLAAPGVSIFSTYPGGQYAYYSGTSMASPMVAGVAALMIAERPALNSYNVKTLVMASIDSLNQLNNRVQTSGRLDINSAIGVAKSAATLSAAPVYNIANSAVYQRNVASVGGSSGGSSGGGCGTVHAMGSASATSFANEFFSELMDHISLIALLFLPVFAMVGLRMQVRAKRHTLANRRDFNRIDHQENICIKVEGREIMARTRDLSASGLAIVAETGLAVGAIVEFGEGVIGRVVWSRANNSFGIQIENGVNRWCALMNSWVPGAV